MKKTKYGKYKENDKGDFYAHFWTFELRAEETKSTTKHTLVPLNNRKQRHQEEENEEQKWEKNLKLKIVKT